MLATCERRFLLVRLGRRAALLGDAYHPPRGLELAHADDVEADGDTRRAVRVHLWRVLTRERDRSEELLLFELQRLHFGRLHRRQLETERLGSLVDRAGEGQIHRVCGGGVAAAAGGDQAKRRGEDHRPHERQ